MGNVLVSNGLHSKNQNLSGHRHPRPLVCRFVHGGHDGAAVGGFAGAYERDGGPCGGVLRVERVEEEVEGVGPGGGQVGPGLLAVGAFEVGAGNVEVAAVVDVGVALGAADFGGDRFGHVHPGGGERTDCAAAETEERLAGLVTVGAVFFEHYLQGGGHPVDVAQNPQHQIERVRAEVAESADPGLLQVGHPQVVGGEEIAHRAGMTVDEAGAGDLAEDALRYEILEGLVDRDATAEIAGLKKDAGLFDGGGHAVGVLRGDAEWFFDEHVLACGGGGGDERLVLIGFGADDNAVDGGVAPDGVDVVESGRAELVAAGVGASGVSVPDGDGADIGAGLQALDEAGCVDVSAADECNVCHEEILRVSVWLPLSAGVEAAGGNRDWGALTARLLSVADRWATRYRAVGLRAYRGTMAALPGLAQGACFAGAGGGDSISFAARRRNSVSGQSSVFVDRSSDNWEGVNRG